MKKMNYFEHLIANWRVAARSGKDLLHDLSDMLEHFIHGLIPFIKWNHQQPEEEP